MVKPTGLEAFAALDPAKEVFPGITADDLVFAMTPGPSGGLRHGTAAYRPGGDPLHRLHWYAPATRGTHPAVLLVHSGSWAGGDAGMYLRYASDLAGRGFVAASMNYRLAPRARWPDPADDVAAAIAWLRDDPLQLGVADTSVAVAGGSAGAQLAAMAVLAPRGQGATTGAAAAVLWYPPLRLATMAALPDAADAVAAFLGGLDETRLEAASPLAHVSTTAPPIMTLVGDQDPICPEPEAREFHAALTRLGVPNELVVFPGGPHGFDLTRRWYDASLQRMTGFLAATLPVMTGPR